VEKGGKAFLKLALYEFESTGRRKLGEDKPDN